MMEEGKRVEAVCQNCGCHIWIFSDYINEANYCSNCDSMEYFTVIKKEEQKMEENKITTEQNVEEIDHPSRYCKGKVECIDAIEAATSNLVGVQAVDTGAVIRYLWRWADKGGIRDLEKAKNYIDFLIKDIQENGIRKQ